MKLSLLEDLVCPACAGTLALDPPTGDPAAEVTQGWLTCGGCSERFPVIKGVPRMLLGELRQGLHCGYPEFFRGAGDTPAATNDPSLRAQLATMQSFGYEWREFSDIRPEGEAGFRWYFETNPPETLRGKTILDVGCGKGRHLFYAAQAAHKVIGVDLSPAVDAAFANTGHLPNAHVVQADVFRLPLRPAAFDMVYSLGVLHHLPDPEAGFRTMLRHARPGADVLVYLYWSLDDEPRWKRRLLAAVTQLRKLTVRMPFPLLKAFALVAAVGCDLVFVIPHRILRNTRWRPFAETLPLKSYADSPFIVLYQDQFDRFSAPIEHRYSRAEVETWFMRAGLKHVQILRGAGWRACGRLALPPDALSDGTGRGSSLRL